MRLKILSWNIWFDGYFDQISQFLQESNADIIGLQEVVSDDKTRDVISFMTQLGYKNVFSAAFETWGDKRTVGNAVFSKYKIVSNKTYVLSETESRNAVRADIKVGDKILNVFSTHLLHTHQQPSEVQELQAVNLVKALPASHTIVMGDFNATPESSAVQKMRKVLMDTDPGSTPTWSVYPEGCPKCNPQDISIRLDYIFTSKDLKTSQFKVESSKGSDHLPVSVEIEI